MAIAASEIFSLGELIAKAREDAHLDQEALGAAIGVSRRTISRWENGHSEPTVSEFKSIASATRADWLLRQFSSYLSSLRHLEAVPMPEGQMELALAGADT